MKLHDGLIMSILYFNNLCHELRLHNYVGLNLELVLNEHEAYLVSWNL